MGRRRGGAHRPEGGEPPELAEQGLRAGPRPDNRQASRKERLGAAQPHDRGAGRRPCVPAGVPLDVRGRPEPTAPAHSITTPRLSVTVPTPWVVNVDRRSHGWV